MELLGHGGMGVVYKGRQPFLDRLVAIKVIRPDLQADDAFQERFLREARTLAKLRHPFIVTVFDVCKSEDLYCLVMEYVEGVSLRQMLAAGSVTQRDALDFVQQMTDALQHAHETGVVHRDIKPENVLVDSLGRLRLVDFGLATLLGPDLQTHRPDDDRVVGTLRYMAPEQMTMPQAVDHRADIYSTGVVFYEMLAHELPGPDRVPPSRKAATDPGIDPIVLRAIEYDRDRRYADALMHHDISNLSRTPESTIRIEQHIAAPPEQVFAAWTNPMRCPTGTHPRTISGRPWPKSIPGWGKVSRRHALARPDDPQFVSGQYCQVDAPDPELHLGLGASRSTTRETQMTLEFEDNGTNLVLTHERFRSEPDRIAMRKAGKAP